MMNSSCLGDYIWQIFLKWKLLTNYLVIDIRLKNDSQGNSEF